MQRDDAFLRAWRDTADASPGAEEDDSTRPPQRYRTLWISDLHLGTPGCQAKALLDFLKHTECETLFLVGDIIDGWQLRRQWYWPQAHNDVIQKLLRKARRGTRVIFVPGNHDEFARKYLNHTFGGIEVAEEWVHETADGRKLWIIHGDLFDGVIQCAKWLAHVGDSLSEFTLKLDPENLGVMLRRKLDYQYPDQRAEVSIRDESGGEWRPAGVWYLAGSNTCVYSNPKEELGATYHEAQTSNRRFRDDEFLLPRDLTKGRSAIRVRVKFTPLNRPLFPGRPVDEQAWSEIRYDAYCFVLK